MTYREVLSDPFYSRVNVKGWLKLLRKTEVFEDFLVDVHTIFTRSSISISISDFLCTELWDSSGHSKVYAKVDIHFPFPIVHSSLGQEG